MSKKLKNIIADYICTYIKKLQTEKKFGIKLRARLKFKQLSSHNEEPISVMR